MKEREALDLVLEAFEEFGEHYDWCHQFPTYAFPENYPPCNCGYDDAITAIKEALAQPEQEQAGFFSREAMKAHSDFHVAQPEQEPVAWATQMGEYAHIKWGAKRPEYPMVYEVPLYTTPPQRTWIGLTDDELELLNDCGDTDSYQFARSIEAKLKEKNA